MLVDLSETEFVDEYIKDWDERNNKRDLFYKCKFCKGSGLKDFKFGGYWTGEFCDECNGRGLFYFFEIIKEGYRFKNFYIEEEKEEC